LTFKTPYSLPRKSLSCKDTLESRYSLELSEPAALKLELRDSRETAMEIAGTLETI